MTEEARDGETCGLARFSRSLPREADAAIAHGVQVRTFFEAAIRERLARQRGRQ
jgi:hypothetical protein